MVQEKDIETSIFNERGREPTKELKRERKKKRKAKRVIIRSLRETSCLTRQWWERALE